MSLTATGCWRSREFTFPRGVASTSGQVNFHSQNGFGCQTILPSTDSYNYIYYPYCTPKCTPIQIQINIQIFCDGDGTCILTEVARVAVGSRARAQVPDCRNEFFILVYDSDALRRLFTRVFWISLVK